ncbi:MAG: hypothetical protein WCY41_03755 [Candidatus Micrarchaeia archaeon]
MALLFQVSSGQQAAKPPAQEKIPQTFLSSPQPQREVRQEEIAQFQGFYDALRNSPRNKAISDESLRFFTWNVQQLYNGIKGEENGIGKEAFGQAMVAFINAQNGTRDAKCTILGGGEGKLDATRLVIVDLDKPEREKRFFVINLSTRAVEDASISGSGKGSLQGVMAVYGNHIGKRIKDGLDLHGLESCNKQAYMTGTTFHPGDLNDSLGCVVIPGALQKDSLDVKRYNGGLTYYEEVSAKLRETELPTFLYSHRSGGKYAEQSKFMGLGFLESDGGAKWAGVFGAAP